MIIFKTIDICICNVDIDGVNFREATYISAVWIRTLNIRLEEDANKFSEPWRYLRKKNRLSLLLRDVFDVQIRLYHNLRR